MKFLHDLLLFLAIRRVEPELWRRKGVYTVEDASGGKYEAFTFRWRGKDYVCDLARLERDGALAALNYEINRQDVIAAMIPRDWAEL